MHEEDPLWIMGGNNYAVARAAQYAQNQSSESCEIANARRIVACVNACEGVPTELLEAGPNFIAAAGNVQQKQDERIAALEAENARLRAALQTALDHVAMPKEQRAASRAALNPAPEAAE